MSSWPSSTTASSGPSAAPPAGRPTPLRASLRVSARAARAGLSRDLLPGGSAYTTSAPPHAYPWLCPRVGWAWPTLDCLFVLCISRAHHPLATVSLHLGSHSQKFNEPSCPLCDRGVLVPGGHPPWVGGHRDRGQGSNRKGSWATERLTHMLRDWGRGGGASRKRPLCNECVEST